MINSVMGMNGLQSGMQAMLAASSALSQAQVQGSVVNRLNGRANVLESEISSGNGNIEAKKEELAEVRQSALDVTASQGEMLGQAQDAMKEIADTDTYEAGNTSSLHEAKEEAGEETVSSEDGEETGQGSSNLVLENAGENVYTGAGKTIVQKADSVISVVA